MLLTFLFIKFLFASCAKNGCCSNLFLAAVSFSSTCMKESCHVFMDLVTLVCINDEAPTATQCAIKTALSTKYFTDNGNRIRPTLRDQF